MAKELYKPRNRDRVKAMADPPIYKRTLLIVDKPFKASNSNTTIITQF